MPHYRSKVTLFCSMFSHFVVTFFGRSLLTPTTTLFSDVNIATERRKDVPLERNRGGFSGRGGRRYPRSPSPPYRPHHDRFEMDRPSMRWERDRMGWRGASPPMGDLPYRDREREHYDRFPPPHMRDPYARPRDDPYERYPRDRDRFGPPRDYYGPPRDAYPPPRDRYPHDYPPHRGSPPPSYRGSLAERDQREEWERERRPPIPAPTARPEVAGDEKRVDMEIIVINRQQR